MSFALIVEVDRFTALVVDAQRELPRFVFFDHEIATIGQAGLKTPGENFAIFHDGALLVEAASATLCDTHLGEDDLASLGQIVELTHREDFADLGDQVLFLKAEHLHR